MAMYYMDMKTFLKDFVPNMDKDDILNTEYAVVSNSLRVRGGRDNVESFARLLPKSRYSSDYMNEGNDEEFFTNYYEQLQENIVYLAILLGYAVEHRDVIILTAPADNRIPYMKAIIDFVYNEFKYPIIDFKKIVMGKEKIVDYNRDEVNRRVQKVLKKAKKDIRDQKMSSKTGRQELFNEMTIKEMKKTLKKMNIYDKGMSKKEIKSTMKDFFVEDNDYE